MRKITVEDPGLIDGKRRVPPEHRWGTYDVIIKTPDEERGPGAEKVLMAIELHPGIYSKFMAGYIAVNALVLAAAIIFGDTTEGISMGGAVVTLQFFYFLAGFISIPLDKLGGLFFFGKAVQEVNSGIFFRPLGFFQVVLLPKGPFQEQFPADPEKVYKGGDKSFFSTLAPAEREQFKLPIRALTAAKSAKKDEEVDAEATILDTQMTIELNGTVRAEVDYYMVFLIRVGSILEAVRQLRDTFERVAIEEVAKRTPNEVVRDLSSINAKLHDALETLTQDWGLSIIEAVMLSPDLTYGVNEALAANVVEKAKALKTRTAADASAYETKVKADAEEHKLTAEGKGRANARQAELEALAKGGQALGVEGSSLIELDKVRALANGKTTVFIDGGGQNGANTLFGIGARLAAGAKQITNDKE